MNRPIKNRFKSIFLYLAFILTAMGCFENETVELEQKSQQQAEEPIELKPTSIVRTLKHEEIPTVINDLMSRIGKSSKAILNGKVSHNNVDIILEDIKEIVNKGENINYTFAMDVKGTPNHIYNLIMTQGKDGNMQEPVIVVYNMKPEDMEAFFKSGEDYKYFVADYKYYKLDTFFEDSKFNRAGNSGDCGGGSTGGSTGSSSETPPGGTFNHNYDGHTVTNIFSNNAVNIPYGYSVSIRTQNAQVSTVSTAGTSGTVQISTTGPNGTLLSHNVPPNSVSIGLTSESVGSSGPGAICLTITTFGDGHVTIDRIPCHGAQQKMATSSTSGDCGSPDGTFAINTAARAIEKLDYHLPGGLNAGQLIWFNDSNFPERKYIAQDLVWFMLDNNKSEESITFVLLAVDALVKGGSVYVDEQIINKLTGKAKCVYEKLKESSEGFRNAIKKFDGEFPVSHLQYTIDYNLDNATNAVTNNSGELLIDIKLNGNTMEGRTVLGLARTFAHETIHAELYRKVKSVGGQISINDFPGIYDYYRRYVKDWQHQQMAAHYRETIADILEDFDSNNNSREFYMDIAWEGLHGTVAWNTLSNEERTRITAVNNDYKSTGNKNCE